MSAEYQSAAEYRAAHMWSVADMDALLAQYDGDKGHDDVAELIHGVRAVLRLCDEWATTTHYGHADLVLRALNLLPTNGATS